MSIDALIDEVRRRRTPSEPLHVTAIEVLASADLEHAGADELSLARAGWAAVRAEGATERFPSLSRPSLELVRAGVELTDEAFQALPEDDQIHVVLMGFLSLVGEQVVDELAAKPKPKPKSQAKPRTRRAKAPPPG